MSVEQSSNATDWLEGAHAAILLHPQGQALLHRLAALRQDAAQPLLQSAPHAHMKQALLEVVGPELCDQGSAVQPLPHLLLEPHLLATTAQDLLRHTLASAVTSVDSLAKQSELFSSKEWTDFFTLTQSVYLGALRNIAEQRQQQEQPQQQTNADAAWHGGINSASADVTAALLALAARQGFDFCSSAATARIATPAPHFTYLANTSASTSEHNSLHMMEQAVIGRSVPPLLRRRIWEDRLFPSSGASLSVVGAECEKVLQRFSSNRGNSDAAVTPLANMIATAVRQLAARAYPYFTAAATTTATTTAAVAEAAVSADRDAVVHAAGIASGRGELCACAEELLNLYYAYTGRQEAIHVCLALPLAHLYTQLQQQQQQQQQQQHQHQQRVIPRGQLVALLHALITEHAPLSAASAATRGSVRGATAAAYDELHIRDPGLWAHLSTAASQGFDLLHMWISDCFVGELTEQLQRRCTLLHPNVFLH
jgi:hypothetical protein